MSQDNKITTSEAIRQSMAEGIETPKSAIDWIKEKFGIELSMAKFLAIRHHVKKDQIPFDKASVESHLPSEKHMVFDYLGSLLLSGKNSTTSQGRRWIMEKYGVDVPINTFEQIVNEVADTDTDTN